MRWIYFTKFEVLRQVGNHQTNRNELAMSLTSDQQTLDDNAKILEVFVTKYLEDRGIVVYLISRAVKHYGMDGRGLIRDAINDLTESDYTPMTVVEAAPSLHFLAHWATHVSSDYTVVIPTAVIPSPVVLQAALRLFHASLDDPIPA